MGVRFPIPEPSILFIFINFRGSAPSLVGDFGHKIGYSAHPMYFQ